jgi:hypothetical protein
MLAYRFVFKNVSCLSVAGPEPQQNFSSGAEPEPVLQPSKWQIVLYLYEDNAVSKLPLIR